MAESTNLPTGMLPSIGELRDIAQMLHQIRDNASTTDSTAQNYSPSELIQPDQSADRIDNGTDRRVAA